METNSKLIMSLIALCILMLSANPAYAYLDPGTGSMVVQAVIAAVAAVSVSIGIFRRRLISLFGRIFGRKDSGGLDSDDS